eukprot:12518014-Alexandrium_andersonii.AAC.1
MWFARQRVRSQVMRASVVSKLCVAHAGEVPSSSSSAPLVLHRLLPTSASQRPLLTVAFLFVACVVVIPKPPPIPNPCP